MGWNVREIEKWLTETLDSPLGQLALLLLIPLAKLVYGYLRDRQKPKTQPPGPSSVRA